MEQAEHEARTSERPPLFWGFAAGVGLAVVATAASAAPALRPGVLWILTAPARAAGLVLPGATLYEKAQSAAAALGWLGWALTPLALAPLVFLVAAAVTGLVAPRAQAWVMRAATPLRRAADAADATCDAAGALARWATLALVAVVLVVVVQRYVFGLAFTKLQESILYLHAGVILLGGAWALGDDGHVRVDVLYGRMSARAKAAVDLAGAYLLLGPMAITVLLVSRAYLDRSWRVGEGSPESDGLALVFLLKTLIPIFAVLLLIQAAALAARAALRLAGCEPGRGAGGDRLEGV